METTHSYKSKKYLLVYATSHCTKQ